MITENLNTGDRLAWGGVEYEIGHIDRRTIRFMKTRGGDAVIKSISEFKSWAKHKKIKVISASKDESARYANVLSVKEKGELERRMAFVKGVTDVFSNYSSKDISGPSKLINEIASIRNETAPGFSTVCSWIKKFINSNYNPHSLLPRWKNQKRSSKFGGEIEQFISDEVDHYYLNNKIRFNAYEIAYELHAKLEDFTLTSGLPSTIQIPSVRTLQRRISEIDPYKKLKQIYGKEKAGKVLKAAGKQIDLIRIFQAVEADGNHIDVIIVNELNKILGRAYLTVLIDRFSRSILSYEISVIPFSSHTLQIALKGAFNTDNGLPGGKIERLIVDNGGDYISSSIKNLCNYSGIEIEYAPPRTPNSKPFIERFFKTLNSQFIHKLPGTTFSNPDHRGGYDSVGEAQMTLKELREALDKFIGMYHNSFHQGLKSTPAQIMKRELNRHVIHSLPSEMIDRVAKTVITRTINKGRITAFNSKWFSHALRTIEHKFEGMGISKKDRKVDVYVDVLNLGKLLIKDPFEEDNFIVAESTTPIYHNGLSLYEHNLFQEKRSAEFKVDLKTQRALTIERMEFIRSLHQSDSKSDRKKIARLSEVDSEDVHSEDIDYIEPKEKIVEKKQNKASPINLRQKISAPTFEVEED